MQRAESKPVLVLIDDIDKLHSSAQNVVMKLLGILETMADTQVVTIGTLRSIQSLPSTWVATNRFELKWTLQCPTEEDRYGILNYYLKRMTTSAEAEKYARRLASMTGGYACGDLARICGCALLKGCSVDGDASLTWEHLIQVLYREMYAVPTL